MQVHQHFGLKPYNTFGINAYAENFAIFNNTEELQTLLEISKNHAKLIIGGGSNILLTQDVKGYVLKNNIKGIELIAEKDTHYFIKAWGGEIWHEFVMHCIENNYGGLENLSLIPGCVGAAPMQNIGAYGVEIKDVFHALEAWHIHDQCLVHFGKNDCAFGYRESVFKNKFKNQFVLLNVTFCLPKTPTLHTNYGAISKELEQMGITHPTIKDVAQAIINIRTSKLPNPALIGNAGSFFKNPVISEEQGRALQQAFPNIPLYPAPQEHCVKVAAGWLIEQAGWKGFKENNYGVHDKQALVLVNYGGAKGNEVYNLSSRIIADIEEKFGITLEREVNIL